MSDTNDKQLIDWTKKIYFCPEKTPLSYHKAKFVDVDWNKDIYYVSNGESYNRIEYDKYGTFKGGGAGLVFFNLTNEHPKKGVEDEPTMPENYKNKPIPLPRLKKVEVKKIHGFGEF